MKQNIVFELQNKLQKYDLILSSPRVVGNLLLYKIIKPSRQRKNFILAITEKQSFKTCAPGINAIINLKETGQVQLNEIIKKIKTFFKIKDCGN